MVVGLVGQWDSLSMVFVMADSSVDERVALLEIQMVDVMVVR